jgi:hypothetical protein
MVTPLTIASFPRQRLEKKQKLKLQLQLIVHMSKESKRMLDDDPSEITWTLDSEK